MSRSKKLIMLLWLLLYVFKNIIYIIRSLLIYVIIKRFEKPYLKSNSEISVGETKKHLYFSAKTQK